MYMRLLVILCISSLACLAQENPVARKYGSMVDSVRMKDQLAIIASDAMEGRLTGERGQKMAAAFIAHHFHQLGLEAPVNGSYYQPFRLTSIKLTEAHLSVDGVKHHHLADFFYVGDEDTDGEKDTEVIFVGKGRDEDLAQAEIRGKSVMCWIAELTMETITAVRQTTANAKKRGARHVFVAFSTRESFERGLAMARPDPSTETLSLTPYDFQQASGRIYIAPLVAEKILRIKADKLNAAAEADASRKPLKKIQPGRATLKLNQDIGLVDTENVLGYLPGTDKKDELVVVTAHYDHVGKIPSGKGDLIYNGADDNGSGTVAILELARVFAQARKDGAGPRRSMLFMALTGEEEGLFGSEYYVHNPVFPLDKTVVNLNLDMVGRVDEVHTDNRNFVYVIGSDKLSSELHEISERNNKIYTGLTFDYTYNDQNHPEQFYYRSDHWNFAQRDIPIIFYMDGVHPDYHRVTDEVAKIEFGPMTLRTQCVFYTAWEVANRDEKLKVDRKSER